MTLSVDMFFHKKDDMRVGVRKVDVNNYILDINNGCERITLFFFDEKGLRDFKNQVVQQYEMLKRRGGAVK